jgi:hypothetical protein
MVQVEPAQTGVGFVATALAAGATTNAVKVPANNESTKALKVSDRIREYMYLIIRCFLVKNKRLMGVILAKTP